MTGRFDRKVVFLTGAASATGIGRATALAFAERGAKVVVGDASEAGAETIDLLKAAIGHEELHQAIMTREWGICAGRALYFAGCIADQ